MAFFSTLSVLWRFTNWLSAKARIRSGPKMLASSNGVEISNVMLHLRYNGKYGTRVAHPGPLVFP